MIDIDRIDQSVEIDDTLVSFIDLFRFYRIHRFISEDTSVHSKMKTDFMHANSEFVDNGVVIESRRIKQFIMIITFLKKSLKKLIFSLKLTLKSLKSSDGRYWPGL